MNSVHDCGGMEGLGPIDQSPTEPIFSTDWERRTFALMWAAGANGFWNIDESRHSMERIGAVEYLTSPYFEHWFSGIERMLIEKGVITAEELEATCANKTAPRSNAVPALLPERVDEVVRFGFPLKLDLQIEARFAQGDRVITHHDHPHRHTRLPRYARGKMGMVVQDHGIYPFADTNAHGDPKPQHVYLVRFSAQELWGPRASAADTLCISLWEDHLDPAPASA